MISSPSASAETTRAGTDRSAPGAVTSSASGRTPATRERSRGRPGGGVEGEPAGTAQRAVGHLDVDQVHRRRADERGAEEAGRAVVDLQRRADLLHPALVEDGDAVTERHRLDLVVGDVDHRRAELGLQVLDLGTHVRPQLRVQVGERLVHEEGPRPPDQRAGQRDALLLPTGQPLRPPVQQRVEPHHPGRLGDPLAHLRLGQALGPQREGEVVAGLQVRVEGVELEHHGDVALGRRQVVDQRAADADVARRLPLESGHGPQRRGLAAARRTEHDEQLAVADGQVHVLHRDRPVGVALVQGGHLDAGHQRRTAPRVTPATRCLRTR